jgi:tetratricopeptide (TPR) repeat protein
MVVRDNHSGGFGLSTVSLVLLSLAIGAGLMPAVAGQSRPTDRRSASSPIDQLTKEGQDLAAQGRFAEAEVPLKQAAELAPENYDLLTLLGKVEGRLGKQADAIALFRRVVSGQPKMADAHVNLAIALADAGNLEEALKETSTAISLSPKLVSAHLNRARVLADLHRPQEAEKEFAAAHQLAPDNPDDLFYWALLERDRGNLEKQTSLFQQLVRLQPDNLKSLLLLAQSLQRERKDAETIAVLRHMLQLKPNSENALYMLSMELRRTNPEEAKKLQQEFEAQKRKEANVAQVKSLGNEAYVAASKQDWPEAIRILKKAVESCEDCEVAASLHKNLGLALCSNGNLEEGKQELQEALKLNPNDPDVVKALNVVAQKQ